MTTRTAEARTVRLEAICKRFGRTQALDGAELELLEGEVHAVVGENGAGKTTLLSVLAGLVSPDAGRVSIGGAEVQIRTAREAWNAGIGMVHQHFALVPALSVIDNLMLGRRGRLRGWRLPATETETTARELMERTGLVVDLTAPVAELGVGQRQRVEILKVLLRDPRVVVLDEPTAVLTPSETDGLLNLLRSFAAEGRAVALVAHKLDEVLSVADRVTVLRRGRTVLQAARDEVDGAKLSEAMVGRTVSVVQRPPPSEDRGEVVARLRAVHIVREDGTAALDGVDLTVGAGQIVGIAGVEGNGQRELAHVLARRIRPSEGLVELPAEVGFVSEDRQNEGLIGGFDLTENLALARARDRAFRTGPFLRWRALRAEARDRIARFGVQAEGPGSRVRELSGGNQQRWVLARELSGSPRLLVARNPTRGLDLAAESFVHGELLKMRESSTPPGIVLISTDLDEILRLADRIHVLVRGSLRDVPTEARTREGVGALMLAADAEAK